MYLCMVLTFFKPTKIVELLFVTEAIQWVLGMGIDFGLKIFLFLSRLKIFRSQVKILSMMTRLKIEGKQSLCITISSCVSRAFYNTMP